MQAAAVSTPVSFGQAILASLTTAFALFFSAIPKIIGFIVILAIGWWVAGLLARGVASLLRAVRFNDFAQRSGYTDLADKMGLRQDAAGTVSLVARWFIRLIVLVVAFDALGIPAVSNVLQQLLLWLPNLIVAMVVLMIGGLAAKALGDIVRGATAKAGFRHPDMMASITRGAIITFSVVVALTQLGVATVIVNSIVIAALAGVALAAGLAFGLGAQDQAREWVRNWSQQGREARPKLERAAQAAKEEARQRTGDGGDWVERALNDRRKMVRQ